MKTPWKFIAGLVSRGNPADSAVKQTPETIEIKALPAPVVEEVAEEHVPDHAADTVAEPAVATEVEERAVERPAEAVVEATEIEPEQVAPEPVVAEAAAIDEKLVEAPAEAVVVQVAKPTRRKSVSAASAPEAAQAVKPQPSSAERNDVAEAADLDLEIQELRKQLAQKLRLQNAQLKKMLERFERS